MSVIITTIDYEKKHKERSDKQSLIPLNLIKREKGDYHYEEMGLYSMRLCL